MNTLDQAKYYRQRGFSIIPLKAKDKKPGLDSWKAFQNHKAGVDQFKIWFGDGSESNIGIVTGEVSGITVVDLDGEEAVKFAKENSFPQTPLVKTAKGFHAYYKYKEGTHNFQKRDDLPGIDLRSEGGYVVAPPSIHPSGHLYQWVEGKTLDDLPLAELPEIILAKNPEDKTPLKKLYQGVPDGQRNVSLTRLVGSWVNDGLTLEECLENANLWNSKNDPTLPEKEIYSTVKSIFEKHHREKGKEAVLTETNGNPVIVCLDSVEAEAVSWLWKGVIPLGKVSLFDGDPGVGKSLVCVDLVARTTTTGIMPDGCEGVQGGAVILTVEDGLADTIVPRLELAGGDKSKVVALQGIKNPEGAVRFPTVGDVVALAEAIRQVGAKLVVIDPLMGYLGKGNSWRDQDMRIALSPLVDMADKEKIAVIVIRHLNKSQHSNAIYRGGGSIGIIGVARAAYLIAKNPEDGDKRIFAPVKMNLAPMPPSLAYEIEDVNGLPRILWKGTSNHTADELLSIPSSEEERSALDEAKDFLRDILSGGSVSAKEIIRESKSQGIAEKTLHRAKKLLSVTVSKQGYQGQWFWGLKSKGGQENPKMANKNNDRLWTSLTTFDGSEILDLEHETDLEVIE